MYVDSYEKVPFKILRYLISDINYGGRVIDDKDGKLINAILNKYFNELLFDQAFKFSDTGNYLLDNHYF